VGNYGEHNRGNSESAINAGTTPTGPTDPVVAPYSRQPSFHPVTPAGTKPYVDPTNCVLWVPNQPFTYVPGRVNCVNPVKP